MHTSTRGGKTQPTTAGCESQGRKDAGLEPKAVLPRQARLKSRGGGSRTLQRMTTQRPPFCPPVLVYGSGSCHTIRDDVMIIAQRYPGGWFGPPRPTPFGPSCQDALRQQSTRSSRLKCFCMYVCITTEDGFRLPNSRGTKAVSPRNGLKNPEVSRCRCARGNKNTEIRKWSHFTWLCYSG